jgi:hypothetical protein
VNILRGMMAQWMSGKLLFLMLSLSLIKFEPYIKAVSKAGNDTGHKHLRIAERGSLKDGANYHDDTTQDDSSTSTQPISDPEIRQCANQATNFLW